MIPYLGVFFLFWLAGCLDYLVQAPWWGWPTPVDMLARSPKLVWYLDWIPRDYWHVAQFLRNLFWIGGASWAGWLTRERRWWEAVLLTLLLYNLSRGLSSSLILQIAK